MKKLMLLLPVLSGVLWGSAGIFVRTLDAFGFDNCTMIFIDVYKRQSTNKIIKFYKKIHRKRWYFNVSGLCSLKRSVKLPGEILPLFLL